MFSEAFLSVVFGFSRNGTDIFAIVSVCVKFCACLSVTIEKKRCLINLRSKLSTSTVH
jgi:hypothetical protein